MLMRYSRMYMLRLRGIAIQYKFEVRHQFNMWNSIFPFLKLTATIFYFLFLSNIVQSCDAKLLFPSSLKYVFQQTTNAIPVSALNKPYSTKLSIQFLKRKITKHEKLRRNKRRQNYLLNSEQYSRVFLLLVWLNFAHGNEWNIFWTIGPFYYHFSFFSCLCLYLFFQHQPCENRCATSCFLSVSF